MPMPEDHIAMGMAALGRLRASHADREQVIGVLKAAFVQGRLTRDEFGTRVGQVFTSKTYAELTAVTADLPAGLMEAQAPRQLATTRPWLSMSTAFSAGAFAMLAALVGMLAAIANHSEIGVLTAAVGIAVVGVLTFAAAMAASWLGRTP
jgi:Domain of unknown function (DUF1707)